jgi:hypothetical protein
MSLEGRGLLSVFSRIIKPELLSDGLFTEWYAEEHIPDALGTSGMTTGFRYYAVEPPGERPWLALYPVQDLGFFTTAEFRAVPVESHRLPGKKIFDLAHFDTRYYQFIDAFEAENVSRGRGIESY